MIRKLTYVREHEIEKHLVKRCKEKGWLCWKFVSPGLRGVPDRIVFKGVDNALGIYQYRRDRLTIARLDLCAILGRCVALPEIKAPGEKPTPQQLRRHAELRALGFEVVTLSSKTEVDWWVDA